MEYTTVTLYHNAGFDPETRADTWTRSVHTRALWHGEQATKLLQGSSGLTDASEYTVRIFTQDALAIAPDDLLVLGECAALSCKEISRGTPRCKIASVTDARRGSVHMRHWKIGGV